MTSRSMTPATMKSATEKPVYKSGMVFKKHPLHHDAVMADTYKGLSADKAIIVMELLRCNKRPDDVGVGPNRDDKPIFKEIVEKWDRGESVDSQLLFMARHRVQKYRRQIESSQYALMVKDASQRPIALLAIYKEWATSHGSDSLLNQEMMAISDYGNW